MRHNIGARRSGATAADAGGNRRRHYRCLPAALPALPLPTSSTTSADGSSSGWGRCVHPKHERGCGGKCLRTIPRVYWWYMGRAWDATTAAAAAAAATATATADYCREQECRGVS